MALDSSYVQVKTVGSLDVDIVDSTGNSVALPSIQYGNLMALASCQISTAVSGTGSHRLRISNGAATNGWSVSAAPTGGPGALYSSGANQYDFNDPSGSPAGCGDGSDLDTKAGQLTVSPANATVTPIAGCSNVGITKGAHSAYVEGSVDAITLLSASAGADMYCAWDITNIALSQTIPASTPVGSYALDLTITSVAS